MVTKRTQSTGPGKPKVQPKPPKPAATARKPVPSAPGTSKRATPKPKPTPKPAPKPVPKPTPKPAPKPAPKPTPSAQSDERWTEKDDVTVQQLVVSTEAGVEMAQKWRQEQQAKELAEWNDPRARYQAQLDRWWQAKLDLEAALDDGYVNVGGFRERRRPTCHRGPGDSDWGLK